MALPSKKQQIEAVAKFLDSERNEGRSLEEIATDIVEGFHEAITRNLKKPASPPRAGVLLKNPLDTKVWRVAWLSEERGKIWLVTETSSYGWLGPLVPQQWDYFEEYNPKKRVEIDGKGKMVEMTKAEIEEAWTNPDWKVGDQVSLAQRKQVFEILATGPASVLMIDTNTGVLGSDSAKNLSAHYRRELKGGNEW